MSFENLHFGESDRLLQEKIWPGNFRPPWSRTMPLVGSLYRRELLRTGSAEMGWRDNGSLHSAMTQFDRQEDNRPEKGRGGNLSLYISLCVILMMIPKEANRA